MNETNKKALYNWNSLKESLSGLPGLMLPVSNEKQTTNGYAFVIRVLPKESGIKLNEKVNEAQFRDSVVDAIRAEGVPVTGPRWLLPAHTVIQAKNGYGKGCPWTCHIGRQNIDYNLEQYPISLKVRHTSIQIDINGHRPPNGNTEIAYC